ncbi:MAG TPA: MFS transporter [Porticoccaceae bacterium]|nr:MFS transporter [Pseudomonadota bacterium]HLS98986.1 MFS transporter [Porticoccaceae bacterium]
MQHHESPGYARYVLAVMTLTYTCSYIDRYILSVLVEPIKAEFGVSDTLMGLLGGFAFALLYTLAGIPIARWADRGNRRTIIALGVTAWSLMTVACGFARSFFQLALARVGVGLGEAACTPPAHSLLADYFPPEKRATALAIYSMGIPFGVMFGFLAGGWIAHFFDWRTAFLVVGAPGLLLALVVHFTVREPARGRLDTVAPSAPFSLRETLGLIFRHRALLLIQLGGAFYAIAGYGLSFWIAPFFARVHQLPLNELASWLALGALVGGVGGSFAAGWVADRLGRRGLHWYFLTPAIALLVGIPVTVVMLTVADPRIALALFLVQQFTFFCYSGPIYAVMQFLVPSTMRAMVVAVHLFVLNLVGLGFGPLLIGMMNDAFAVSLGSDGAIRQSLLVITLGTLVSVLCFWLAAGKRDGKPIAVPIPAR